MPSEKKTIEEYNS